MHSQAPSPEQLRRLKDQLGKTGEQMAELFGLAGGQQWRKYTGGEQPREMSMPMLFLAAARLTLPEQDIERVLSCMREIGAEMSNSHQSPITNHLKPKQPT